MKRAFAVAGVLILAAACGEIPQDAPKPYAGKEDTKAYASDLFKGDKQKYEQTLAHRANYQNEYVASRAAGLAAQTAVTTPAAPAKQ